MQATSNTFSSKFFEYNSDKGATLFCKASKNTNIAIGSKREGEWKIWENVGKGEEGVIISNIWLGFFRPK